MVGCESVTRMCGLVGGFWDRWKVYSVEVVTLNVLWTFSSEHLRSEIALSMRILVGAIASF